MLLMIHVHVSSIYGFSYRESHDDVHDDGGIWSESDLRCAHDVYDGAARYPCDHVTRNENGSNGANGPARHAPRKRNDGERQNENETYAHDACGDVHDDDPGSQREIVNDSYDAYDVRDAPKT